VERYPDGHSILDSGRGISRGTAGAALDQLTGGQVASASPPAAAQDAARLRSLHLIGILSGFSAGAWLGAAEAPTKLVKVGVSPVIVSLVMVLGVFLARWSVPALLRGTQQMRIDVQNAPHLVVWGILAGCLWAVANTMTIFAIRDIGLSIAFPLWNTNSLIGIFWGYALFNELRDAGPRRWLGILGGAGLMFVGALLLAMASSTQTSAAQWGKGVAAALAAGMLWGTMYIPYRKAYLTGMNPLSFVAFFTIGELAMMLLLALSYSHGGLQLLSEIAQAKGVLFWLMLGGFVWVIGDIFQQYAAKYVGISRGIPLSNTNQLWGLAWGILVFGELRGRGTALYMQVVAGSLIMAGGAALIALASVTCSEHARWEEAARREGKRYGIDEEYVQAGLSGGENNGLLPLAAGRTWLDWTLLIIATAIFVALATVARVPELSLNWTTATLLGLALIILLAVCGSALWKTTRFN
jgi:drug/metabolite transporter (DMT)-like permease